MEICSVNDRVGVARIERVSDGHPFVGCLCRLPAAPPAVGRAVDPLLDAVVAPGDVPHRAAIAFAAFVAGLGAQSGDPVGDPACFARVDFALVHFVAQAFLQAVAALARADRTGPAIAAPAAVGIGAAYRTG